MGEGTPNLKVLKFLREKKINMKIEAPWGPLATPMAVSRVHKDSTHHITQNTRKPINERSNKTTWIGLDLL